MNTIQDAEELHRRPPRPEPRAVDPNLVSIVVIFHNAAPFLSDAIESVFGQTYRNWELLLVDDGSTDGSEEIARSYAERHPNRVRYLEHGNRQNLGKSVSRNLGAAHARGGFLAFLDADDLWLPNKLDEQVAMLRAHPGAAMIYGRTQYWHSWAPDSNAGQRDSFLKLGVRPNHIIQPPGLLTALLRNEHVRSETICPHPSNVLLRREVFDRIGGFEASFRDLYDDVVFFAKAFLKVPVFVSDSCWDKYRIHGGGKYSNSYAAAAQRGDWNPNGCNPAERQFLEWLAEHARHETNFAFRAALWESLLPYRHPAIGNGMRAARRAAIRGKQQIRRAARRVLSRHLKQSLGIWLNRSSDRPPPAKIRWGSLDRLTPVSRCFGYDRGQPIDRYYIEHFLSRHAEDVRGHVLEIADDTYTRRFGSHRVSRSDVLHATPGNPAATLVADLANAPELPSDKFDCIICTQTLLCIFDVRAAIATLHRILKPGGVILATVPGICQIAQPDIHLWGDYWRFTSLSARRLFETVFPPERVHVETRGNVKTAVAFLHGFAVEELSREDLDHFDPDYQVSIAIRASKP